MSLDPNTFQHSLVDVHGTYRGGRTAHEVPDELITDVVTARTLRPHITRWLFFFVLFFVSAVSWILFYVLAQLSRPASFLTGSSGFADFASTMETLFGLATILIGIAWTVSLFLPLREQIAEYSVLVENRVQAFPFVFSWIAETVLARQSPFELNFGKVGGIPVLMVSNERVRGMVTVRQVGTDLFLGWHMWRNRSTMTMIGHLLRDMFQRGQAWAPAEVVRSGWSAAMRELLHSVTREGAQAAMLDAAPDGFTPAVRIEQLGELDVNAPAAPRYAGPPPAAPAPPAPRMAQPTPSGARGTGNWWSETASGGNGNGLPGR